MLRLLQRGAAMATLGAFTSAFTETGANLGAGHAARREALSFRCSAPKWVQALRPLWIVHHRLRRMLGGMYSQNPLSYAIYTRKSPDRRVIFHVERPSPRQHKIVS